MPVSAIATPNPTPAPAPPSAGPRDRAGSSAPSGQRTGDASGARDAQGQRSARASDEPAAEPFSAALDRAREKVEPRPAGPAAPAQDAQQSDTSEIVASPDVTQPNDPTDRADPAATPEAGHAAHADDLPKDHAAPDDGEPVVTQPDNAASDDVLENDASAVQRNAAVNAPAAGATRAEAPTHAPTDDAAFSVVDDEPAADATPRDAGAERPDAARRAATATRTGASVKPDPRLSASHATDPAKSVASGALSRSQGLPTPSTDAPSSETAPVQARPVDVSSRDGAVADPAPSTEPASEKTSPRESASERTRFSRPVRPEIPLDPADGAQEADTREVVSHRARQAPPSIDRHRVFDVAPQPEQSTTVGDEGAAAPASAGDAATRGAVQAVNTTARLNPERDERAGRDTSAGGERVGASGVKQGDTAQVSSTQGATGGAQEARTAGESRAASAPAAPQPSPGEQATHERATVAAANRGLDVALRQQGGSVQLRLAPESLGALRVEMHIARGTVAATLHASTPEARELLSRNIETLRSALEARGLSVERLSITLAPASHGGSSGHSFNAGPGGGSSGQTASQSHAGGEHDAAGERSKGSFAHDGRRGHDREGDRRRESTDERFFTYRAGLHAIA